MKQILFLCALLAAAGALFYVTTKTIGKVEPMFTLMSNAFAGGAEIPKKYTCDGENISPQLSWYIADNSNVGSYVLIMDDPDAQKVPGVGKTFVHWIAELPASASQLPEGASSERGSTLATLYPGAYEVANDFNKQCYMGPCPPQGDQAHHYQFTLFAVDKSAPKNLIHNTTNAAEAQQKLAAFIIAQATLIGNFGR